MRAALGNSSECSLSRIALRVRVARLDDDGLHARRTQG
jgi:hypothetical protein